MITTQDCTTRYDFEKLKASAFHEPLAVRNAVIEVFERDVIPDDSRSVAALAFDTAVRNLLTSCDEKPSNDDLVLITEQVCRLTTAGLYYCAWKEGRGAIVKTWKKAVSTIVRHGDESTLENLTIKIERMGYNAVRKRHPKQVCKNGRYDKPFAEGVRRASFLITEMMAVMGPRENVIKNIQALTFAPPARDPS